MNSKSDMEELRSKIEAENRQELQQAIPTSLSFANLTRKEQEQAKLEP